MANFVNYSPQDLSLKNSKRKRSVSSNFEAQENSPFQANPPNLPTLPTPITVPAVQNVVQRDIIYIKLSYSINKKSTCYMMLIRKLANLEEISATIKKTLMDNAEDFSEYKIFGIYKQGNQKISMPISSNDQAQYFWTLNYSEFNLKIIKKK